jgi:NAD+ kinase
LANTGKQRVCFIANPDKPDAAAALDVLRRFAESRCQVVGVNIGRDGQEARNAKPDRIVVLGGDGTLIGVARSLGADQIPLIGVNVGKLGFLTEFSVDELKASFGRAVADDDLIDRRIVLEVTVTRGGKPVAEYVAINDCVIQAGPPFRIIELGIDVDGERLTALGGDGVIVSTPAGSTGHSLSAGGPIMQPGVDAIILTPLNPHSLTHKPIVIERDAVIDIVALDVNDGTTLIVDGQVACPLRQGDNAGVKRFGTDCRIVRNPNHSPWHKLVTKLHWGRSPDLST